MCGKLGLSLVLRHLCIHLCVIWEHIEHIEGLLLAKLLHQPGVHICWPTYGNIVGLVLVQITNLVMNILWEISIDTLFVYQCWSPSGYFMSFSWGTTFWPHTVKTWLSLTLWVAPIGILWMARTMCFQMMLLYHSHCSFPCGLFRVVWLTAIPSFVRYSFSSLDRKVSLRFECMYAGGEQLVKTMDWWFYCHIWTWESKWVVRILVYYCQ